MNNFYSRKFKNEDSSQINNLYRLIKGVNRTDAQYSWEWLKTWDGIGSSWLMFDSTRPPEDQLVCQYSLIPIPLSYYGKSCIAGKTENCMSHPDLRGKRVYFPHEKKYFEEAKSRFQAFFTTTGKGAPGRVRRKLGYYPLDLWTRYYYFHNLKDCIAYHRSNAKKDTTNSSPLKKFALTTIKSLVGVFEFVRMSNMPTAHANGYSYKIVDSGDSTLEQIEKLWNSNKENFGITIARTQNYMRWRIDENPYHDYKYLFLYKDKEVIGYIVFNKNKEDLLSILDVIVDKNDNFHLIQIFRSLITESKRMSNKGIICRTVFGNELLEKAFAGFGSKRKVSKQWIENQQNKGKEAHDFYGVVLDSLDITKKSINPKNWYITALFLES